VRILMLAQFYPPTVGGEERHVQTLSTELAARGHEVAVATLWHPGLADFEVDRGVHVYRVRGTIQRAAPLFSESARRHAPPFTDPELAWRLSRVVRQVRPQIVHAHNWLVHSFLPLKAWSGAKLILSLHDYSLVCTKKVMVYNDAPCTGPGLAKCLRCARDHYGPLKGVVTAVGRAALEPSIRAVVDLFLPVSRATAEGNSLVADQLPFEVIPNFLSESVDEGCEAAETYLDQLPDEPFLLFAGDLSRFKGVEVMLRAYSGLRHPPPLVLIGRRCTDTPADVPPGVLMLGSWPHPALMAAWRRCMLGLLPSIGPETFGIVLLEAMAAGRPVIASRIGGPAEVVLDGETGYLVPPGDAEALQTAIQHLLDDPDLRMRMGRAAQQWATQFRASSVIPRVEAIYSRLLEAAA
jgi:glycosyltransferase involved in cell wall biosynthesis